MVNLIKMQWIIRDRTDTNDTEEIRIIFDNIAVSMKSNSRVPVALSLVQCVDHGDAFK